MLSVQRHQAGNIGGGEIVNADQFNNRIIGADGRFGVFRRNEVFVTAEVEESYTRADQCFNCCILCRREIRCVFHIGGYIDNVVADNDLREVDLHTGRRVQDPGFANARGASGRSRFRARADNEFGRACQTKRHTIAEGATCYLIGSHEAPPDKSKIAGTVAQGGLRTGSAQEDVIAAVALDDDTVLGVVLDDIVGRAALNLEPGIGDRDLRVEACAILEQTSAARVCGTGKNLRPGGRREQRVPITWTNCHFGGRRPWFTCCARVNDRYCGRRVAVLYAAGELFACGSCYNLAYESQQGGSTLRSLSRSLKIRVRLGGSPGPFPEEPRGMHRRTYLRLREHCEAAEAAAFGHTRPSDGGTGAATDAVRTDRVPKLKRLHDVPT
jgi:hypothetical protein